MVYDDTLLFLIVHHSDELCMTKISHLTIMDSYMTHDEQIEKIRQAIMRYRELLDILKRCTEEGEQDYDKLFENLKEDQKTNLEEKKRQRQAAIIALDDLTPLRRAILRLRFEMRDMEQAFEALYNNIAFDAEN